MQSVRCINIRFAEDAESVDRQSSVCGMGRTGGKERLFDSFLIQRTSRESNSVLISFGGQSLPM